MKPNKPAAIGPGRVLQTGPAPKPVQLGQPPLARGAVAGAWVPRRAVPSLLRSQSVRPRRNCQSAPPACPRALQVVLCFAMFFGGWSGSRRAHGIMSAAVASTRGLLLTTLVGLFNAVFQIAVVITYATDT